MMVMIRSTAYRMMVRPMMVVLMVTNVEMRVHPHPVVVVVMQMDHHRTDEDCQRTQSSKRRRQHVNAPRHALILPHHRESPHSNFCCNY